MSLIRRDFERVAPEIVKAAARIPPCIFADVAGRRGTMDGRIRALAPSMKVCGPAFTVEVRPGDNLMLHAAYCLARPGDVVVVDGKADTTSAITGGLMTNQAKAAGLAGLVVDAAVRDAEELRELGFPVFSVGTNPNGPTKFVPGRINHPISCGGVAVHPGDLIVGDADGVTVIPREEAASLIDLGVKKMAEESRRMEAIQAGKLRPGWLDAALRAAGVLKEGESL
jgi:4-hydroxy-4-methyl-2-oxoglutarate aldolase